MTEIDKAIEHYRYGISHDIFSEPVTTYARLAIAALQEQQEREQGCECCQKVVFKNHTGREFYQSFPAPADCISNQGEMCLAYDTDGWSIHFEDFDDTGIMCDVAASKCPMCGAKLEAEAMAAIAGGE